MLDLATKEARDFGEGISPGVGCAGRWKEEPKGRKLGKWEGWGRARQLPHRTVASRE